MGCGKDKGLYGHLQVPTAKVVKNPSTTLPRKSDSFMSKLAGSNLVGAVGKAAPIAGKGQQ